MPKVSIIVPVYKVEKFLDRCMQTLLNQTLHDIEIILVDDGSPDKCPDLCDEYANKDNRVKVIHKINGGLGYARNSGIEIATGEYIAFVDSDDYVEKNTYEILYNNSKKCGADITLCGYKRINNGSISYYNDVNDIQLKHNNDCISVLKGMIGISYNEQHYDFAVWHGLYRNELIQKNIIRFCSERDYISEDIIFHLSIIPLCKYICIIPDYLYCYCLNENTLTTKYKPGRLYANIKLCKYISDYINNGENNSLKENIQDNIDYLVIDKTISNLSYEVKYNTKCLPALKEIVNNEFVRESINRYPVRLLSKKQYYLTRLIKMKCIKILYLTFYLKSKIQ